MAGVAGLSSRYPDFIRESRINVLHQLIASLYSTTVGRERVIRMKAIFIPSDTEIRSP